MPANPTSPASRPADLVRQVVNLLFGLGMVLLSLQGLLFPVERDPSAPQNPVPPVTPASFTFFISFLIYAATIAYVIYQALPRHRHDRLMQRVGWYTAAFYLGAIAWLLAARARYLSLTVVFILWILVASILAYIPLIDRNETRTRSEHWLVRAHVSVLLGWVSVLTVANITAALMNAGITALWVPEQVWAIGLLALEALIVAFVIWVSLGDGVFTATAVWCFAGIAIANIWRDPNPGVAVTAGIAATFAVAVWLIRTGTPEATEGAAVLAREA